MLVSITFQNGQNKSLPWRGLGSYSYQHRIATKELTIQATTTCATTIQLYRPMHVRVLQLVGDALLAMAAAWDVRLQRRRMDIETRAIADMNEALLRDIGAPDWMIAEATARREIDRQHLTHLHSGRRDWIV